MCAYSEKVNRTNDDEILSINQNCCDFVKVETWVASFENSKHSQSWVFRSCYEWETFLETLRNFLLEWIRHNFEKWSFLAILFFFFFFFFHHFIELSQHFAVQTQYSKFNKMAKRKSYTKFSGEISIFETMADQVFNVSRDVYNFPGKKSIFTSRTHDAKSSQDCENRNLEL